jgi:hypothetical protein
MRRFQCHRALHLAFFQPDKEATQAALNCSLPFWRLHHLTDFSNQSIITWAIS